MRRQESGEERAEEEKADRRGAVVERVIKKKLKTKQQFYETACTELRNQTVLLFFAMPKCFVPRIRH